MIALRRRLDILLYGGVWLAFGTMPARAAADDGAALAAGLRLPRGVIYAGQMVEGEIVVVAGAQRPEVDWPKGDDLEIAAVAGGTIRPVTTSGIGDLVREVREYHLPFRAVFFRPGEVIIPPIRVTGEGRTGATAPRKLTLRAVPSAGRTGAFLGGVGRVEAEAGAEPLRVRVGETIRYDLRLSGPGASGSIQRPALDGLDASIRVGRPTASRSGLEPPVRTFWYDLRMLRAGRFTIPPVRVAWFDPASQRYQTTLAQSVAIEVRDVPSLDAGAIRVEPGAPPQDSRRAWPRVLGVGVLLTLVVGSALIIGRRWRRSSGFYAESLIRALPAEFADGRTATDALAAFFERVGGRPPGVLTPVEARAWTARLHPDQDLPARVEALVARGDRAAYSGRTAAFEADRAELVLILKALGRSGKPREAPGTVS